LKLLKNPGSLKLMYWFILYILSDHRSYLKDIISDTCATDCRKKTNFTSGKSFYMLFLYHKTINVKQCRRLYKRNYYNLNINIYMFSDYLFGNFGRTRALKTESVNSCMASKNTKFMFAFVHVGVHLDRIILSFTKPFLSFYIYLLLI
jgi:hypothetical protein